MQAVAMISGRYRTKTSVRKLSFMKFLNNRQVLGGRKEQKHLVRKLYAADLSPKSPKSSLRNGMSQLACTRGAKQIVSPERSIRNDLHFLSYLTKFQLRLVSNRPAVDFKKSTYKDNWPLINKSIYGTVQCDTNSAMTNDAVAITAFSNPDLLRIISLLFKQQDFFYI